MKKRKKGSVSVLTDYGWSIALMCILLSVGAVILAQFQTNTSITASTNATRIVNQSLGALTDLVGWLPIIVIIIAAVVIVTLLFTGFGRQRI